MIDRPDSSDIEAKASRNSSGEGASELPAWLGILAIFVGPAAGVGVLYFFGGVWAVLGGLVVAFVHAASSPPVRRG